MYEKAKQLFLEGYSLRKIEEKIGYDRKKLSYELKQDGITIKSRGINICTLTVISVKTEVV